VYFSLWKYYYTFLYGDIPLKSFTFLQRITECAKKDHSGRHEERRYQPHLSEHLQKRMAAVQQQVREMAAAAGTRIGAENTEPRRSNGFDAIIL